MILCCSVRVYHYLSYYRPTLTSRGDHNFRLLVMALPDFVKACNYVSKQKNVHAALIQMFWNRKGEMYLSISCTKYTNWFLSSRCCLIEIRLYKLCVVKFPCELKVRLNFEVGFKTWSKRNWSKFYVLVLYCWTVRNCFLSCCSAGFHWPSLYILNANWKSAF